MQTLKQMRSAINSFHSSCSTSGLIQLNVCTLQEALLLSLCEEGITHLMPTVAQIPWASAALSGPLDANLLHEHMLPKLANLLANGQLIRSLDLIQHLNEPMALPLSVAMILQGFAGFLFGTGKVHVVLAVH